MFKELIDAIQQGVKGEAVGSGLYTRPVYLPPAEPMPTGLQLTTLQGVVDYVEKTDDANSGDLELFIHVESPTDVSLLGSLHGRHQQRPCYVKAISPINSYVFGRYQSAETFLVELMSLFEATSDRDKLLAIVGNLRDETIKTQSDDGFTQTATVRQGVARVAEVEISNPVELQPYRTFAEVEQPLSNFIFRMRKGAQGVECVLIEADGGRWRLDAIANIAGWLKERLPEAISVVC